jgi:hypothetical protein
LEIENLQMLTKTLHGSQDPYLVFKKEDAQRRLGQLIPLCQSEEYLSIAELQTEIAALEGQVQQPSVDQKSNTKENDDTTTTARTTLNELKAQLLARESEAQRKTKVSPTNIMPPSPNKKQKNMSVVLSRHSGPYLKITDSNASCTR